MKDFLLFLDDITPLLSNNKENDIDEIRIKTDKFINKLGLNKKQLVTKWIEIHGESTLKVLQVSDAVTYFKTLNLVLSSSLEYISNYNDPLYLLAQLSIMSDWYSFKALNI